MSRREPSFSESGYQDHKLSVEALESYQKRKMYHKAADQLNEHSVPMGVILRAMADPEQRNTNDWLCCTCKTADKKDLPVRASSY
jgi:hypothetical protein